MSLQQTSIDATEIIKKGKQPKQAWAEAILKNYPHSVSMQKKSCPRDSFLGLCSEGMIKGVKTGNYTSSKSNKQYAITAISLLKNNGRETYTSRSLWLDVLNLLKEPITKRHNRQMDIVLKLWDEQLVN